MKINVNNKRNFLTLYNRVKKRKIDMLADRAFEDQCTNANPRVPLVEEMKQILRDSYLGIEIE